MTDDPGVAWLLESADPSVRYRTLTELCDRRADDPDVVAAREAIATGPRATALLSGQHADGGFGIGSYTYWVGTHWRLLGLAHLCFPPGDPRIAAALEDEMRSLVGPVSSGAVTIRGRVHRHACIEGNALGTACRLGFARDERVTSLAAGLVESQWPDGGWNNQENRKAKFSAVYETHEPLWGLIEYHAATGDVRSLEAARAAAECLLARRLVLSYRTARPAYAEWNKLHFPLYWHYDVLQALDLLRPLGLLGDERAAQGAETLLAARNNRTGTWRHNGRPYWMFPAGIPKGLDPADWGRRGPNEFITLRALRVLKAAGLA